MPRSHFASFGLAAISTFFALLPSESHANDQRVDASACFVSDANYGQYVSPSYHGVINADIAWAFLSCPVPDRSDFLPQNMATINVHGYAARSDLNVEANAQTIYWGSNNGGRGSLSQTSSGIQNYQFGFGTSQASFYSASDGPDYKLIYVGLPPIQAPNESTLRGLYFST